MHTRLAHISDLHIVSNTANLQAAFWDFLLLVGPPAAAMPFLKPYLDDPEKRKQLWKQMFYRPDEDRIDYRKVAAVTALSLPAAFFLVRQLLRLRRIFYLRRDAEAARAALLDDLHRQEVDHVVITGDTTNTANDAEFEIARDFLSKLSSFTQVTLIPGNHDVDIHRLVAGKKGKLDRYIKHFGSFLGQGGKPEFPVVRQVGEVCLLGLDSTTFNPVANSRGKVSPDQLDRLNDVLHRPEARSSYKVLVIHHHVLPAPREKKIRFKALDKLVSLGEKYFMGALKNADEVLKLARENDVHLVLHGHKHRMYEQEESGTKLHCAGSTTGADGKGTGEVAYRVHECKGGEMRCRQREVCRM